MDIVYRDKCILDLKTMYDINERVLAAVAQAYWYLIWSETAKSAGRNMSSTPYICCNERKFYFFEIQKICGFNYNAGLHLLSTPSCNRHRLFAN